jgi:hypothetical protein
MMRRSFAAIACMTALLGFSPAALALTVVTDPKGQPESITAAPDGGLILGSSTRPVIFRAAKGETQAKVFIDLSSEGNFSFLGVLADPATNTLWACQIGPATPGAIVPPSPLHGSAPSTLRSFDLATGAKKISWKLPGDNSNCNDFSIGPDHALYVSDTFNSRIYRVKPGGTAAELFLENRVLYGIDGLTFLNGVLYANNVFFNNLYRIPMDASGKAGTPEQIWTDRPIKGPDGMRAANGKLYLAENGNGRASMVTITGDQAHVVTVLDGLTQPTAIEPAGDILWVGDRARDNAIAIPMPR